MSEILLYKQMSFNSELRYFQWRIHANVGSERVKKIKMDILKVLVHVFIDQDMYVHMYNVQCVSRPLPNVMRT